ncbi:MAG: ABC transporter permease [Sulfolobaceae archaeon]|nr:ABC transporter permease [Sulfolobaceae archaeon]
MSEVTTGGLKYMLKMLIRDKAGLLGLIIVSLFLGWSFVEGMLEIIAAHLRKPSLGWVLLPYDPLKINLALSLKPPSLAHIMGTNLEGQDIFSRILYAMPWDAFIAVVVVFSAIIIGALLGIFAGWAGGWVDELLMRITDAFLTLPALILVIAISVLLGPTYQNTIFGLIAVWWPTYARFYRAQVLRLKGMDFVQATRLSRVSRFKFYYKYLFLNSIDPIIAYAALDFGNVILTYATLAFLGIGKPVGYPELGAMASDGLSALPSGWWWPVFPGLTILVIVVGFVLLGDRLQDIIAGRVTY